MLKRYASIKRKGLAPTLDPMIQPIFFISFYIISYIKNYTINTQKGFALNFFSLKQNEIETSRISQELKLVISIYNYNKVTS